MFCWHKNILQTPYRQGSTVLNRETRKEIPHESPRENGDTRLGAY